MIHSAVQAPRRPGRIPPIGQGVGALHAAGRRTGRTLWAAARAAGSALARHWLFAAFVLLGLGLRVVVSIAYWPGIELFGDSYDYLRLAHVVLPGNWHPSGYPLLLSLISLTGQLGAVVVIQHLMGIVMALLVYLLGLRLGARRWLAAVAALPVLLDGYQLDLEQFILPEALTSLLLLGTVAVLLWRERVSGFRGAIIALLLAAAVLTRTATVPVLGVVALYLLIRAGRWRGLLAFCAVAAVVLVGYGAWYAGTYGYFGYSEFTGFWLYGRVAPFATCNYPLPVSERALCPRRPVGQRSNNSEYFANQGSSPVHNRRLGGQYHRDQLAKSFATTVIEHQPLAYASAVLADTWHYFAPGRWMSSDIIDMQRWRFPPPHRDSGRGNYHVRVAREGFNSRHLDGSPNAALAGPLRTYQWYFYTPGLVLLGCLLAALGAAAGLLRRGTRRRHARWAALVLAASSLVLLLSPSLTVGFSYRYGIPLLVLLPLAGAVAADIGLENLARLRPALAKRASRPKSAPMIPAGGSSTRSGIPER